MAVVISLLRGVNVGPHNRMKMDALRALYESIGLENPQTYVQSGNVVFRTNTRGLNLLAGKIEKAIESEFGFHCDVILRNVPELRNAVAKNPFADRRGIDPSKLLVTFLSDEPSREAEEKMRALKSEPEELHLDGRELYIYFPDGMARPKISWMTVVNTLKVSGTGRNWNSVRKILQMAEKQGAVSLG